MRFYVVLLLLNTKRGVCLCVCVRACVYMWVSMCVCVCVRAWVCVRVRACMRACVRACARACLRTCVCSVSGCNLWYDCTYLGTHIHRQPGYQSTWLVLVCDLSSYCYNYTHIERKWYRSGSHVSNRNDNFRVKKNSSGTVQHSEGVVELIAIFLPNEPPCDLHCLGIFNAFLKLPRLPR